MQSLTITISRDRAEFVRLRAAELGLASPDELVDRLLDAEVQRRNEQRRIDSLLVEGLAAEPGDPVTDEWWKEFDSEVFGHSLHETEQ